MQLQASLGLGEVSEDHVFRSTVIRLKRKKRFPVDSQTVVALNELSPI
jgi:hypothetical protein